MAYDNAAYAQQNQGILKHFLKMPAINMAKYVRIVAELGRDPFQGNPYFDDTKRPLLEQFMSLWGLNTLRSSLISLNTAYGNENYLYKWYQNEKNKKPIPRKTYNQALEDLESLSDGIFNAPRLIKGKKDNNDEDAPKNEVSYKEITTQDIRLLETLQAQIADAAQEVIGQELAKAVNTLNNGHDRNLEIHKERLLREAEQKLPALIGEIARNAINDLLPREIIVTNSETKISQNLGALHHEKFELLLNLCQVRGHNGYAPNIWLTGPTGSGKTTAAENVATALSLPFGADSSLDADYKVIGFRNATGEVVRTLFRDIFENGGIYVADEADNWSPSAWVSLNAALSNNWCAFPDGIIKRHPNCIIIACANTWGLGATNDYVGRNKLDAATLNRFLPKLEWPIDENLEMQISEKFGIVGCEWAKLVQTARKRAKDKGLKIVISPRDTFTGAALLNADLPISDVITMTFGAGLTKDQIAALT